MSLQIKTKAEKLETLKAQAAEVADTDAINHVISRYREVQRLKKALKDWEAELEKALGPLRDELNEMFDPDSSIELPGTHETAILSVVPKKVVDVNKQILIDIIGIDAFIELAQVPIGEVRKYLSDQEQKAVLTEERQGTRRLSLK